MKVLKTIGIVLLAILALWLIAAAFMPKHFEYERSTTINAPKEVVFNIIDDLKMEEIWGPWKKEDPTMQLTYGEQTKGVGASYSWTSEKSGNGSSTTVESTPPSYHKSRVEFEGQGGGDSWFKLEDAEGGGTKTAWGMAFDVPWPFNFFMAVTGSSSMNEMFEKGLAGLKELAEQKAAEAPAAGSKYEVKEMDFPGQHYLGIREKISFEKMADPAFYGERFGQIQAVMQKAKMEIAGYPTNVYYVWDDANKMTDMAIALPTQSAAAVSGKNIASFEIPAGKALVVDYYGPYEGIADAHIAMDEYIKAKGWQQKSPVLEQYVTDPGTEPDTSKWLTKVLYFVGK